MNKAEARTQQALQEICGAELVFRQIFGGDMLQRLGFLELPQVVEQTGPPGNWAVDEVVLDELHQEYAADFLNVRTTYGLQVTLVPVDTYDLSVEDLDSTLEICCDLTLDMPVAGPISHLFENVTLID
jgi:hypothetical protein